MVVTVGPGDVGLVNIGPWGYGSCILGVLAGEYWLVMVEAGRGLGHWYC